MTVSKTQTFEVRKSPPNFMFPPRYAVDGFAEASEKDIEPSVSSLMTSETQRDETSIPSSSDDKLPDSQSWLLELPLEVRLQIYHQVLQIHPIFHAHLSPPPPTVSHSSTSMHSKPVEELHTTFFQPIGRSVPTSQVCTAVTRTLVPAQPQSISTLHPQSTPALGGRAGLARGKIPTTLLLSCRQVYEESRFLPWQANNFFFVNWFWSGIYASRQFMRGLRPWQSDAMRWVGVEVLTRDLAPTAGSEIHEKDLPHLTAEEMALKSRSDWSQLCYLWKGVWGLRLGIKGHLKTKSSSSTTYTLHPAQAMVVGHSEELSLPASRREEDVEKSLLDIESEWVQQGLLQMASLRWLEFEADDGSFGREEKMMFCQRLEEALNVRNVKRDDGWDGNVKVVFVEKVKQKVDLDVLPNIEFEWYGGVPGNDSIDGSY